MARIASSFEKMRKNVHAQPKRVALLIESSNAYGRGLLRGIVQYGREHSPWSLFLVERSRVEAVPAWVAHWDGDGIIARIENRQTAKAVLASGLPAVDLSAGRFAPGLPWVETDDVHIARLAFEHLMERGFHRVAFCGDDRFNWSKARSTEFTRLARERGVSCDVLPNKLQSTDVSRQIEQMEEWLLHLSKPIGVFAGYDISGQQMLDACRNRGVAVPEEVAVLGVDDDELLCEVAYPPLSSVVPNSRQAGYQAAALLADMMQGGASRPIEVRVPPLGITARQSTDILAVSDRLVVQALRFIRAHACDPIAVSDVVRAAGVSRRVLEQRFGRALDRSPHAEIVTTRINRVKQLLLETDLSLEAIAGRVGFEHAEYLSVMFKRETGEAPGRFRRQALGRK